MWIEEVVGSKFGKRFMLSTKEEKNLQISFSEDIYVY